MTQDDLGPTGLPDRPYTALTLALKEIPAVQSYSVTATTPDRAHKFQEDLGDDHDVVWNPPTYGETATFAARTSFAAYWRADIDTDERTAHYESRGTRLSPHQGFERYRVQTDTFPTVAAFSETTEFVITDTTIAEPQTLSRKLIDLHHGDGNGWQHTRESYATLLDYLPQGVMTVAYLNSSGGTSQYRDCFGQTAFLADIDDTTVQLRFVVVYESDVDPHEHTTDWVDRSQFRLFPVNDPSIEITDNVAVMTDHAEAADVLW